MRSKFFKLQWFANGRGCISEGGGEFKTWRIGNATKNPQKAAGNENNKPRQRRKRKLFLKTLNLVVLAKKKKLLPQTKITDEFQCKGWSPFEGKRSNRWVSAQGNLGPASHTLSAAFSFTFAEKVCCLGKGWFTCLCPVVLLCECNTGLVLFRFTFFNLISLDWPK